MDKKRKKDKLAKKGSNASPDKLTKEEDAIARFVRFNCATNTTMFEGNEVHYFSGRKAVDVLVNSKKYGAEAKIPKFLNQTDAEYFLRTLLERGLFFRAKKLVLKKKEKNVVKELKASKSRDVSKSPKIEKKEKATEEAQVENEVDDPEREEKAEQEEEKKRKKKIRLSFNDMQAFEVETNDVYVWVFDPTPFWKQCVGVLIVLGTIGGCLFPLWPDWLRLGVYYLSLTGISLFGLFFAVVLARTILFAVIWLCTLGRHHLWVLPNLNEECGPMESFQPLYTYEYVPGGFFGTKNEDKKKKDDNSGKKKNTDEGEDPEKEHLVEKKEETSHEENDAPTQSRSAEESEEDKDEDDEKSVTDESNSWDRLSENSQQSAAGVEQKHSKDD